MADTLVTDTWFPLVFSIGLLLAVVLLFMRRNPTLGVFLFSTYFFAYSIFPWLFSSTVDVKHHWFANPSPIGPPIVGAVFFAVLLLSALIGRGMSQFTLFRQMPWLALVALVLFGATIPVIYLTEAAASGMYGLSPAIKGLISALVMSVVALTLAISGEKYTHDQDGLRMPIRILIGAQCVCIGVAIWEIASLNAWVANRVIDGLLELRASSTFYNPNVFGAWAASMLLAGGFLASRWRGIANIFLVLASLALLLSGSRSMLILGLIVMFIPVILSLWTGLSMSIPTASLGIFSISFLALICAAYLSPMLAPHDWHEVALVFYALADRFVMLPMDLFNFLRGEGRANIEISVEGRFFVGDTVDNSYLAMLAGDGSVGDSRVGYLSAGLFLLFLLSALWAGLRRLAESPCWNGIFAVSAFLFCMALGVVMQAYQVFPVWGFVAVLMSLYFRWLLGDETRAV